MRDLALLTSELAFIRSLATELGATVDELGRRLWSSELTEARAAAMVRSAAHDVAKQFAKAEAEKQRNRPQRAGRRR